jgi:hypothetical protein
MRRDILLSCGAHDGLIPCVQKRLCISFSSELEEVKNPGLMLPQEITEIVFRKIQNNLIFKKQTVELRTRPG